MPVEGESMKEDESSSCPPSCREQEPMGEVDERAPGVADSFRRFSPGASAKFAFRAACYLAGRAADKLVSAYTHAVTLDRDYIADFNKSGGLAHAQNKRWDKAIPLLEKSLTVAPDDAETRMRLAEAYAAEHRYEKACQHLEKVLEITPDSAAAVRALGAICVRQQDYDRAIEYLEKAVRLDPDHAQTHYRLGIAYDNKKRYEQAVEAFKKSIRLDPRFAKAYQALGFAYETMGNRDLAVECFKKALELE
jgi:tetratricopeptide (TPR) repeat protein